MTSRRKGRVWENVAARLLKGNVISRTGEAGPDVRDCYGELHEVKYRGRMYPIKLSHIYDWWEQTQREGASMLTVRGWHKPWLVIMSIEKYHSLKQEEPDRWAP